MCPQEGRQRPSDCRCGPRRFGSTTFVFETVAGLSGPLRQFSAPLPQVPRDHLVDDLAAGRFLSVRPLAQQTPPLIGRDGSVTSSDSPVWFLGHELAVLPTPKESQ